MLSRILAWVLLCVGLFAADSSPGFAQQSKPHPVKQVARVVTCSFVPLTAKSMGIPLCPGTAPDLEQVADTIPGTAGVPSSQVITVQGCTGCISTGSGGGGGGGASYSGVPANAYGQTGTANSFTGIAGFDYATSGVDALTVAPFGGNGSGTGYPAAYGQPGVLVVQGGLQGGAIAIEGNLGGPYGYTPNQLATATSFMGIAGYDGAHVQPINVTTGGAVNVALTTPLTFTGNIPSLLTDPTSSTQANVSSVVSGAGNYNALHVVDVPNVGVSNFSPGQATLTTTSAALIAAARTGAAGTGRASVTLVNNSTTAIYLGGSGVTSSTGLILPGVVGASVTLPTTAAIYGALASAGSAALSYYELY